MKVSHCVLSLHISCKFDTNNYLCQQKLYVYFSNYSAILKVFKTQKKLPENQLCQYELTREDRNILFEYYQIIKQN